MRAIEFFEARRNPEQNLREPTGHTGALLKLQKYSSSELDQMGISMTMIDKIGVNPRSIYNTPNGVYFYPARYYVERKEKGRKLPFQDEADYIQIFSFPEPVLFLDTYTEANYSRDIERLTEALDKIPGLLGKVKRNFRYNTELGNWSDDPDQQSFKPYFDYLDKRKAVEAKVSTPGGFIWYVTWQLSQDLAEVLRSRAANIWNWLLRKKLGYNTVIDYNQSIIYPDEPTQGVVLETAAIARIASINNQDIANIRSDIENISWDKIVNLYAKKLINIHDVRKHVLADATFSAGHSKMLWYLTDF